MLQFAYFLRIRYGMKRTQKIEKQYENFRLLFYERHESNECIINSLKRRENLRHFFVVCFCLCCFHCFSIWFIFGRCVFIEIDHSVHRPDEREIRMKEKNITFDDCVFSTLFWSIGIILQILFIGFYGKYIDV